MDIFVVHYSGYRFLDIVTSGWSTSRTTHFRLCHPCDGVTTPLFTAIAYPPATVTAFGGLTLQRHPTRDQLLPEGNAVPVCTLGPAHGRIERCLPSWRPALVRADTGTVCLKHVGPARVSTRSIVMRRVGGLLTSHRTVLPAITWRRMVCGVSNSSSTTASLGVTREVVGEVEARNGGPCTTHK